MHLPLARGFHPGSEDLQLQGEGFQLVGVVTVKVLTLGQISCFNAAVSVTGCEEKDSDCICAAPNFISALEDCSVSMCSEEDSNSELSSSFQRF